jgi:dimethylargininase
MSSQAVVRPPGASFIRAISTSRAPIDVTLARAQHAEYCQALAAAGLAVEVLPPDERYPDGCFMEDPAVVIAGYAVVGRMGALSRRGEEDALAELLAARLPTTRIVEPGTLEGGDVIHLPDRVLVGRTARTNRAGIAQLVVALALTGLPVLEVPVDDFLHLQTAATYVGRGILLALDAYAGHPAFAGLDVLIVPPEEAYAANTLGIGDYAIVPAGYPRVDAMLRAAGFTVLPVPVSEFAKADGGVTCLSLVL